MFRPKKFHCLTGGSNAWIGEVETLLECSGQERHCTTSSHESRPTLSLAQTEHLDKTRLRFRVQKAQTQSRLHQLLQ